MTLEELRKLTKDREDLQERRQMAHRLNVCYVCGAPLIEQRLEILKKPIKYFWGLYVKKSIKWDHRKVCSENSDHVEYKYNISYD